jgi:hypothetical protein
VTATAQSAPWFYFDEFKSRAFIERRWLADFGAALTLLDAHLQHRLRAPDRRDAGKFQKKHLKTHNSCG